MARDRINLRCHSFGKRLKSCKAALRTYGPRFMPGQAARMFQPELPPTQILIRREWAAHTCEPCRVRTPRADPAKLLRRHAAPLLRSRPARPTAFALHL